MAVPRDNDVTSLYRAMGPFFEIIRTEKNEHIHLTLNPPIDFLKATQFHVAFFQRPESSESLQAIQILKRSGVKIWVEYDDLLLAIEMDHPGFSHWAKQEVRKQIRDILAEADIVTVSTTQLKKVLSHFCKCPVYVVPNAWSEKLYGKRAAKKEKPVNLINWRGSNTHEKDILGYGDAIIEVMKDNPSWKVQYIGYIPWMIAPAMENQTICVEELTPERYFDFINHLQPKIHYVPLFDSVFNQCKSNIAQMEALFSRALPIVPNWPEWKIIPGSLTYSNEEELKERFAEAIAMSDEERNARVEEGWSYIVNHLSLREVNELRMGILKTLAHDLVSWPKHLYDVELDEDYSKEFLNKHQVNAKQIRHGNLQAVMT